MRTTCVVGSISFSAASFCPTLILRCFIHLAISAAVFLTAASLDKGKVQYPSLPRIVLALHFLPQSRGAFESSTCRGECKYK